MPDLYTAQRNVRAADYSRKVQKMRWQKMNRVSSAVLLTAESTALIIAGATIRAIVFG